MDEKAIGTAENLRITVRALKADGAKAMEGADDDLVDAVVYKSAEGNLAGAREALSLLAAQVAAAGVPPRPFLEAVGAADEVLMEASQALVDFKGASVVLGGVRELLDALHAAHRSLAEAGLGEAAAAMVEAHGDVRIAQESIRSALGFAGGPAPTREQAAGALREALHQIQSVVDAVDAAALQIARDERAAGLAGVMNTAHGWAYQLACSVKGVIADVERR